MWSYVLLRGAAKICCRTLSRYATTEADGTTVDRVEEIAKKRNISMAQVALAWILSKDGICSSFLRSNQAENAF